MMKNSLLLLLFVCSSFLLRAQPGGYYGDVDLTLTGNALFFELADKVTTTQTASLSYTPGVWDALKQTDLVPGNSSRVILIYGYNDNDGISDTDRTRGVNQNGGGSTDWNREHVYPKSLGQPNLGTSGPGADAHHLRPADVNRNGSRGSRKFADGSGTSKITPQGHWYPGDEFKGDVARMILFMYIRYGNQCLPVNVGVGTVSSSDANMIDLFLEWNAEDPVSELELQRNPIIEQLQGNRNPFIDNPAFATRIWGGPPAEDRFGDTPVTNPYCGTSVTSFPYAESFEGSFGSWKQASAGDDFNWTLNSGSTPSSGTGPVSADDGSTYAYMEASSPNYSTKRAILYGPCFELSNASQATASFSYHMYGSSAMGSLALEASEDGDNWTQIWVRSGNQGSLWQRAEVNLSAYVGSNVQLRFNGITGTTWQGDMAIDDFSVTTGGGANNDPIATNLTIVFDNYPEETAWTIRDESGAAVYTGGNYGNQADGSTLTLSTPLAPGCYTLTFTDTYGDGICCAYGNGSFSLTETGSGSVLASGGSFGASDTQSFCVGASGGLRGSTEDLVAPASSFATSKEVDFYPNPTQSFITVRGENISAYTIATQNGRMVQQGRADRKIDVSALPAGTYYITFTGEAQRWTQLLIKQ